MNPALLRYIGKRIALMVPTLLGILLITFAIIQFVPGGPVEQMVQMLKGDHAAIGGATASLPGGASQEVGQSSNIYRGNRGIDAAKLEEIKALYGFDKPVHERFLHMVTGFLSFDLGKSFFHDRSVWDLMKDKLPVSISLPRTSFWCLKGRKFMFN